MSDALSGSVIQKGLELEAVFYANVAKLLKQNGYPPRMIDDAYDKNLERVNNYRHHADWNRRRANDI